MKFGVSNLMFSFLSAGAREAVLRCSDICDFAPTALYGPWSQVPIALPAHPYGAGGPMVCALQSLFFGVPNISLVQEEGRFLDLVAHFKIITALAERSSINTLVMGSPGTRSRRSPIISDDQLHERVRVLADLSEAKGLKLCFEVVSPRLGCEFLTRNDDLLCVLRELSHPGLGLHLDVGQMTDEGLNPPRYINDIDIAISHIHLSSPDLTCSTESMPLYRDVIESVRSRNKEAHIILEVQAMGGGNETALVEMCENLSKAVSK
jgi:hypothetical protein